MHAPLLILVLLWASTSPCSFPTDRDITNYSLEQTLEWASVVVSGKDLYHDPDGERLGFKNYTFQVSCVFKSNNLKIPRIIYLFHVGFTSCKTTYMEAGTSYIIALREATEDDMRGDPPRGGCLGPDPNTSCNFVMDEPDPYNSGAFIVTSEKMLRTSALCSMDNETLSLGEGEEVDHRCPVRDVTMDTCVSGASSVLLSRGKLISYFPVFLGVLLSMSLSTLLSLFLSI